MSGKVLVTAALPYANGSIHLGHLLEAIQTDVYVRARKLAGDDVVFIWADDTHGTPIEVRARREGIPPEELIARAYAEHRRDYDDFQIGYDVFHTTHSAENTRHVHAIFAAFVEQGLIEAREIQQLYSERDGLFLPDRFVKGGCPVCKSPDQYGDSCEVCGSTYDPTELIEPYVALPGREDGPREVPVLRPTTHLFVSLAKREAVVREWLAPPEAGGRTRLQPAVRNYVMSWVESGLRDWDISRDAPYFGIEIPGYPGKYFYVWFDAPVGYISATERWCAESGADFAQYWRRPLGGPGPHPEIVHVIGKDIVYFHTLFWPAMLHVGGYSAPSRVHVHGWLKVNGEKMSKSRGTFILARTYLDHLPPDYLRYYFAAKLGGDQDDIDLSLEDFAARVNADLVNKAANLASRCAKFLTGKLGGTLGPIPEDARALLEQGAQRVEAAVGHYREFESGAALRLALQIAEDLNGYLTEQAPWKLAASDPERARAVCTAGLQASQLVAAILKPVLPRWADTFERTMRLPAPLTFANAAQWLPEGHAIGEYEALAERLDPKVLEAIVEASRESLGAASAEGAGAGAGEGQGGAQASAVREVPPLAAEVGIDAFTAVDLRVGLVQACERVEGSTKLLRLTIDLGALGVRTIFSGIAGSYAPEQLVGRRVVVFANLAPRKMRFGVSEGMVLAAGTDDGPITVLELASTAAPGEPVR